MLVRYQPLLLLLARMQIHASLKGKFSESDVVQQTMLEACRDIPEFRGQSEDGPMIVLTTWFRRANFAFDFVRLSRGSNMQRLLQSD